MKRNYLIWSIWSGSISKRLNSLNYKKDIKSKFQMFNFKVKMIHLMICF
jgi:hypothetical protein